jgi:hypothetical protein
LFTRLLYYGTTQLGFTQDEVWLMPVGLLLDLWECHREFLGLSAGRRDVGLDEVVP